MQPARGTRRVLALAWATIVTGRYRGRDVSGRCEVLAEVLGVVLWH